LSGDEPDTGKQDQQESDLGECDARLMAERKDRNDGGNFDAETLRSWVRRTEVDQSQRPGLTTDERQRLKDLEKENRELRRRQRDPEGRLDLLRDRARRRPKK